jgi:hypothetical protein
MLSVTATQLTSSLTGSSSPSVERRQPRFLTRWLDASWFPWVCMALWAGAHVGHALVSWHFFTTGAALLSSGKTGAGLRLYASHPQLQIGPLTFLAAAPLNDLPAWLSGAVAAAAISAAGPAMLLSLSRLPHLTITNRQRGLAAIVLMPVWAELAVHYTHLDDALALALLMAAIHAVARGRPIPAALLLAASAGAKPWALAFVPLLLVLLRDRRNRAVLVWLAAAAAAWLPFVLADPRTLHAGGFSIPNVASSSLRALGVTGPPQPRPGIVPSSCSSGSSWGRSRYVEAVGWLCPHLCWRYGCCLTRVPTRTTPPGWCWPQACWIWAGEEPAGRGSAWGSCLAWTS